VLHGLEANCSESETSNYMKGKELNYFIGSYRLLNFWNFKYYREGCRLC
jgi:hypothetical protein